MSGTSTSQRATSSRGYGFLWHNPATGRAEFATNITRWTADATAQLDYWITAGDSPREILARYADATGHSPDFPEWACGFWQCKLRYRTQDELLAVAREYKARGLPLSCIVIDFFHWTRMGEWKFDPAEWSDPDAMMAELRAMGVETMVSIWPTVQTNAQTWPEMRERGYLMKTERGAPVTNVYPDKHPLASHFCTYYDATNPEARRYVWNKARESYVRHGIANFWIDSCEPELRPNHPEQVRLMLGNGAEVLNAYPYLHIEGFREGLTEAGHPDGVLLGAAPGRAASGTALSFGRAMSGPPDTTSARRSPRGCIPACRASAGGPPISAASTKASAKARSSASCWCAGSSSASFRRCAACTASACRTTCPCRMTACRPTARTRSGSSPPPAAPTRYGATASGSTPSSWTCCSCVSASGPTSWPSSPNMRAAARR